MQNKLGKVAGFFSVLTVLWVTGCIFLKNENWNQKRIILLIGILMIGVLLLEAAKLIGKVEEKIRDSFSLIVLIFIFLYAGLQIEVGLKLRYTPALDLEAIYGGAIEWYTTGDFAAHKDYFYWFGNNLGGMAFFKTGGLPPWRVYTGFLSDRIIDKCYRSFYRGISCCPYWT